MLIYYSDNSLCVHVLVELITLVLYLITYALNK